jgi:hypothetical protein
MTGADFIAAYFWPLVIIFALLLKAVREPDIWRWTALAAVAVGIFYGTVGVMNGKSSLVAIVDLYLFYVVLGGGLFWFGCGRLHASPPDPKSRLKACVAVLGGAGLVLFSGTILIPDFMQPRIVLEGRVQNVRQQEGRRTSDYVADIAGRTVKVTTPVYERLKFLPVVRVEVGRGSGYVFEIEYLAN